MVVLLRHELPRRAFQVWPEFSLSQEPQRIDVVVLRRRPHVRWRSPRLLGGLLGHLGEHTLLHYKGPTDVLERDDALTLLGYACQYQVVSRLWDPTPISLRIIANRSTPRFNEQVARTGGKLVCEEPGVWKGRLGQFDLRLVETAVAWRRPGQRVMYAFSRGFVTDPMGVGDLAPDERAVFQFMAQQVEQLSQEGALKMHREHERMNRSFTKWFVDKVLPTIPAEQRLAGLDAEQRVADLSDEDVVKVLLRRLPKDVAVDVSERMKSRTRSPKPSSRRKH